MKLHFGQNLSCMMKLCKLNREELYNKDYKVNSDVVKLRNVTVEGVLDGVKRPQLTTRKAMVYWCKKLCDRFPQNLEVLDLEQQDFSTDDWFAKPKGDYETTLDVNYLRDVIPKIIRDSQGKNSLAPDLYRIPIDHAKIAFWKSFRKHLKRVGVKNAEFNDALIMAGMPPKLPLPTGKTTLAYAEAIVKGKEKLSKSQQLVWRIASSIYPPDGDDDQVDLSVKEPGRYLAYFWNRAVKSTDEVWEIQIESDLASKKPSEESLVYLLCWLELALVIRTGDKDRGKYGLFRVASRYRNRRAENKA
jgi:hypothetical protein